MSIEAMWAEFEAWRETQPWYLVCKGESPFAMNMAALSPWECATLMERERCAKVCDEQARECLDGEAANSCECCADAIRKGETP